MPPIIVAHAEWTEAQRQIAAYEAGIAPLSWNALLNRLSPGGLARATARTMAGRGWLMAWRPMRSTLVAALLGRRYVYLSWGVAHFTGMRRRIVDLLLRRARRVIVNDPQSAAEVEQVTGTRPRTLPYLVDTDFYTPAPEIAREPYLFCPGANDRDGNVLLALARSGRKVVWMSNLQWQHREFGAADANLSLVIDIPYEAVRDHYRRAAAVVLPLARNVHAAGQTTALEALACATPVVIGAGRTAELLASQPMVTVVTGTYAGDWNASIDAALAAQSPELRATQVARVGAAHGPDAVSAAVRALFDDLEAGRP